MAQDDSENSLLWEISGNGLKKPSYLYGTMHVSSRIAFHLPESFFNALKSVEYVALEINPDNFVQDLLNSPFYKSYREIGTDYGSYNTKIAGLNFIEEKELKYILSKDDNFANYLLYRSQRGSSDFEEDTYLDLFIYQAGKKLNKKIMGLENLSDVMELGIKMKSEEKGSRKENMEFEYEGEVREDLEDAYRKGNLKLIDSIGRGTESKTYREYMLYIRNRMMVNKMDSLLKIHSVFSGVGAAHLPGAKGMINLLREKGYIVKPIKNDGSRSKEKEKIEKIIYRNTFRKHIIEDSLFEVAVPGILHASPEKHGSNYNNSFREYFCADMPNAAYYSIVRLSIFEKFTGMEPEDYVFKIDSLLFENIPGKIVKKKYFQEGKIKGVEIFNITKSGNHQRYKIYFTPLELIVFKVAGIKDYATKEGINFINSVRFIPREENYRYTSPTAGFSFSVPGYYTVEKGNESSAYNKRNIFVQSIDTKTGNYYLFTSASHHSFYFPEKDSIQLLSLSKTFCKQSDYKITSRKFGNSSNRASIEVKAVKENFPDLYCKVIISGPEYFIMSFSGNDSLAASSYFSSLRFTDKLYRNDFTTYTDSIHNYSVITPARLQAEYLYKNDYKDNRSKEKKVKEKYLSREDKLYFTSEETFEAIEVGYSRFSEFAELNKESFWKELRDFLTDDGSLIIKKEDINSFHSGEFYITDSALSNILRSKVIVADKEIYVLKALTRNNTDSRFINEFFNSFTANNHKSESSLFTPKSSAFLDAVYSADSNLTYAAFSSVNNIRFQEKDLKKLNEILEDPKFTNYFSENKLHKKNLIRQIVTTDTEYKGSYTKKLYKEYSDSSHVQILILQTLAKMKTAPAYKSVNALLKEDVPLSEKSEINKLFNRFKDSLQLTASLFPDMLHLTRYQEYKENIYNLSAILLDSGLIKPNLYAFKKEEIIKEAEEEIKRKNNSGKEIRNSFLSDIKPNDPLYNYAVLLMPFYKETNINNIYSKMVKLKDKNLSLYTSVLLLKSDKPVEDSILQNFGKNDFYRKALYKKLKEIDKLEKINPAYITQENICRAILCSRYSAKETDSLVFLEKRELTYNGKTGNVFFFKRKKEKDISWKLEYVGLQPLNPEQINITEDIMDSDIRFSEKELSKTIDGIMEDLEDNSKKKAKPLKRKYSLVKILEKKEKDFIPELPFDIF
ncbi:MAG: TraB/GumN family protein [Cytophagaceae bacterium]